MEATYYSETSVYIERTTRRYIPENRTLYNHSCENLISYGGSTFLRNIRKRVPDYTASQPWRCTLHIHRCGNLWSRMQGSVVGLYVLSTLEACTSCVSCTGFTESEKYSSFLGVQWDVKTAIRRPERKLWSWLMGHESRLVLDDSQLFLPTSPSRKRDRPSHINSTKEKVTLSPCLTESRGTNIYGRVEV
jgi:hypothetical protein